MTSKEIIQYYSDCTLCARKCGVNRSSGERGFCSASAIPHIVRSALHFWEEPIISGERGSGTIFFSSCSLGCIFCQNSDISRREIGQPKTPNDIADLMLSLRDEGAHNVNFVTPTHYSPSVALAIDEARARGFDLPVVYNTGSYDSIEAFGLMQGRVDIYLPDLKYYKDATAKRLSRANDYVSTARGAIDEMVRQKPNPIIKNGIMSEGVIVRVLLLPSHLAEAKLSVRYLYEKYGNSIYISLMSQYTPMQGVPSPLDRRVTNAEYSELVTYSEKLGVVNAFVQEISSAGERFIPDWNLK